MKLKDFKLLFVCLTIAINAVAQTPVLIIDSISKEPIVNAEVFNSTTQEHYTSSINGEVLLTATQSENYLIILAEGYQVKEQNILLPSKEAIVIELDEASVELDAVVVRNQEELRSRIRKLKDVEGTEIYAGKKTEVVQVQNIVANKATNNARQIYAQVVGLNVYEGSDGGLQLNIGGRGLDPNRSSHFNTRQNGYDISADVLGYPESYYTPPAEAIREIQVIRGAASLQYGSQLGGLVNFKLIEPRSGKINGKARLSAASYNTYSAYGQLDGTVKNLQYLAYGLYKKGNGFRPNSAYDTWNGFGKIKYHFSDKTSLNAELTTMNYLAQQPGGLTDAQFYENPNFSNRERNFFKVDWNLLSTRLDHQFNNDAKLSVSLNGLAAKRTALGFRTNRVSQPDDASFYRDLQQGKFKNFSTEARYIQDFNVGGKAITGLVGAKYYQAKNTSKQGVGPTGSEAEFNFLDDVKIELVSPSDFNYPNQNIALFSEQIIRLNEQFSITPGVRFEQIKTESKGEYSTYAFDLAGNLIGDQTLPDNRIFDRNFFLYGIGLSYKTKPEQEAYANFSRNYRSVTFSDIRVVNPSFRIDPNITDETGYNIDLGYKGFIEDKLSFDVGLFGLAYEQKIGEVFKADGSQIYRFRGNLGNAFTYGLESFAEWNIAKSLQFKNEDIYTSFYTNFAWTDSKYTKSAINNVEGNKVEFIPNINLKTGLRFGYQNLLGSFQYTSIGKQFTDATNAAQNKLDNQRGIEGEIPSYQIADLSLSYKWRDFKLETGANNLFNASYFTRRATGYPGPGIIPSEQRSFYGTLEYNF